MTSDSFYSKLEQALRFGDIVHGCVSAMPRVSLSGSTERRVGSQAGGMRFEIEVLQPDFSVILTPCCEISDELLLTAPLERIPSSKWLDNPYISEDPLHLNEIMTREQSVTPDTWNSWPREKRAGAQNELPGYAFRHYFVYPGKTSSSQLLPSYTLREHQVDFYVIDFRHTSALEHDLKRSEQHVVGQKYLQMSPQARETLRLKLSDFYGRIPEEDRALLAT